MRSIKHVKQHGIHTKRGQMQPIHGHVCRRIAQLSPPLLASDDRALDPMPMAQHGRRILWPPLAQGLPDCGGRHGAIRPLQQRGDSHAKAHLGTKGLQIRSRSRASLAETEICAHNDMPQPQTFGQDVMGKGAWCQPCQFGVEWQLIQSLHP